MAMKTTTDPYFAELTLHVVVADDAAALCRPARQAALSVLAIRPETHAHDADCCAVGRRDPHRLPHHQHQRVVDDVDVDDSPAAEATQEQACVGQPLPFLSVPSTASPCRHPRRLFAAQA